MKTSTFIIITISLFSIVGLNLLYLQEVKEPNNWEVELINTPLNNKLGYYDLKPPEGYVWLDCLSHNGDTITLLTPICTETIEYQCKDKETHSFTTLN